MKLKTQHNDEVEFKTRNQQNCYVNDDVQEPPRYLDINLATPSSPCFPFRATINFNYAIGVAEEGWER